MKVDCNHGNEVESLLLLGTSVNEKAEWIADITQVSRVQSVMIRHEPTLIAVCGKCKAEQDSAVPEVSQ